MSDDGPTRSELELIAIGIVGCTTSGVRATLPLLVVCLAHQNSGLPIDDAQVTAWLGGQGAAVSLALAYVLEFVIDKVPMLDHAAHVLLVPVHAAAGAIALAAPTLQADSPPAATTGTLALGATVALGVHAVKATLRAASSAGTGALCNPVVSLAEEIVIVLLLVGALFVSALALALLCLMLMGTAVRRAMRIRRQRTQLQEPAAGEVVGSGADEARPTTAAGGDGAPSAPPPPYSAYPVAGVQWLRQSYATAADAAAKSRQQL